MRRRLGLLTLVIGLAVGIVPALAENGMMNSISFHKIPVNAIIQVQLSTPE